jgi:hypothetical protein
MRRWRLYLRLWFYRKPWVHNRQSNGGHRWRRTDEVRNGSRVWVCTRCESELLHWPSSDEWLGFLSPWDRVVQ